MSHAGNYIKSGMAFLNKLEEGKPHTSVTDWIEVLSGDRYEELSLDGIPELVESVNIQGAIGTQEAARAIRKKLKYGNVHRQLRALVLLRALTENASKGFQLNWANTQIVERLREMATDTLLDPQVKKRLMLVFHAWSIQYAGETRMATVQRLYSQYSGQPVRRGSVAPTHTSSAHSSTPTSPASATAPRSRHAFGDIDDIYGHSWEPSAGARNSGGQNYSDLAAAKADAESRRAARDRQILIEQREAELERREREMKRKADMAALELRRQKDAAEEAERRRLMKENMRKPGAGAAAKPKIKFDLQKEKPNIMVSVATAIQAANNLVNSMRHLNREHENIMESPRVQDNLDKAKAARRNVIRYVQVVNDEELVGTLLEANEKVVEAIQMYDKLSKPAALDSDSEHESDVKQTRSAAPTNAEKEMDALTRRMEAQRLEALRTSEVQKMQERQKRESAREQQRREKGRPTRYEQAYGGGAYGKDLADLDFGSGGGGGGGRGSGRSQQLPRPLSPDSERGSFAGGNLSDFSDSNVDYDSSDEEYRRSTQSRRQSYAAPAAGGSRSRRQSQVQPSSPAVAQRRPAPAQPQQKQYKSLLDDDPFADDGETPVQENKRMQWAEI